MYKNASAVTRKVGVFKKTVLAIVMNKVIAHNKGSSVASLTARLSFAAKKLLRALYTEQKVLFQQKTLL